MTHRVVFRIAFASAAVALGTAVAASTPEATPAAAPKPTSIVIRGFWPQGSGPEMEGAASGRGWLGFGAGDGQSRSTILGSLRPVGGRLSFAKTVLAASGGPEIIVGPQLFYHSPSGELRSVSLAADGSVGRPNAVPGDPERIPPQQYRPVVNDGIQVGDRMVWVLTGSRGTALEAVWACCSSTGELSVLSRFINRQRGMRFLQLGRDDQGRLWLAWLDVIPRKVWGRVRMVELDPSTLSPRTPNAFAAPAPESWLRPQLVCGDRCRVVAGDLGGDILSWAPDERSPTRMHLGTRLLQATLLDASFRSGNLVVASSRTVRLRRSPWSLDQISVARGDARGSRARRIASVAPAPYAPTSPFQWQPPIHASFVPNGLVFFKKYYNFRAANQTRVLAGFLPVGR